MLSQANFSVLLLNNWAKTVSQQVNPLSITRDNTLVNHTTRTATNGVFTLQHKTGAKRKRTATSTSASVARLVHVRHQGNTNSIQTATNQAGLVPTHIQVWHNDIPVPHNMPVPANMGYVWLPPIGYQHAQAPLHVPTNQRDQIEQQSTSSEDLDSSSDDNSDINMLGTTHAYQLCNMPIEGTNIISHPQIQYMEPISTAISM